MFAVIMLLAPLLFIVPPLWMLSKGWPIRAGLTMLLAATCPIAGMLANNDDLPPGAGLLVFAALPLVLVAVLIIMGGVVAAAVRAIRRGGPTV